MPDSKILVIDDELSLLRLTQIMLAKKGFEVHTSRSAAEARELLDSGESFDLIVLDIMMPEEDGIEFLRWLENTLPADTRPRIIASTAKNLSGDEMDFLKLATCDIIIKGSDFTDRLRKSIEKAIPTIKAD